MSYDILLVQVIFLLCGRASRAVLVSLPQQPALPQSAVMTRVCSVGKCLHEDLRRHLEPDADKSLWNKLRQLNAIGVLLGQLCTVEPILCDIAGTMPHALGVASFRSSVHIAGQLVRKELQLLNRRKKQLHSDILKAAHGLNEHQSDLNSATARLKATERLTVAGLTCCAYKHQFVGPSKMSGSNRAWLSDSEVKGQPKCPLRRMPTDAARLLLPSSLHYWATLNSAVPHFGKGVAVGRWEILPPASSHNPNNEDTFPQHVLNDTEWVVRPNTNCSIPIDFGKVLPVGLVQSDPVKASPLPKGAEDHKEVKSPSSESSKGESPASLTQDFPLKSDRELLTPFQ